MACIARVIKEIQSVRSFFESRHAGSNDETLQKSFGDSLILMLKNMNQFGKASQGKLTEKKSVAEIMTTGHGSPFISQVSMANSAKLYKTLLDGLEYRGTSFFQCYTTCQPEHGVADDMSAQQAKLARDSRGMPEFVFDPQLGELAQECFDLKGNPNVKDDWWTATFSDKTKYKYTVAHWATTEAWKLQYCNAYPFPESFIDCLEGKTLLKPDELDCPPTTFTAKGWPKKSRQLGVLERNQAGKADRPARVYFCSQCGHPGHTKRSCKGISEPNFHDIDAVAAAGSSLPAGIEAAAAAAANSSATNYSGSTWDDAGLPLDATALRLELETAPLADNHAAVQQLLDAEAAQHAEEVQHP